MGEGGGHGGHSGHSSHFMSSGGGSLGWDDYSPRYYGNYESLYGTQGASIALPVRPARSRRERLTGAVLSGLMVLGLTVLIAGTVLLWWWFYNRIGPWAGVIGFLLLFPAVVGDVGPLAIVTTALLLWWGITAAHGYWPFVVVGAVGLVCLVSGLSALWDVVARSRRRRRRADRSVGYATEHA